MPKRFFIDQLSNFREIGRDLSKVLLLTPGGDSYSQHGEDRIISSCFTESRGIYIDIGCSLPRRFSNTYFFYKQGWSGIVVDANTNLSYLWKLFRNRDKFLNLAISNLDFVDYRLMEHGFSSTVDEAYAESLKIERNRKIVRKRQFRAVRLEELLKPYFQDIQPQMPCFLNIDVEFHDYNVLLSNNWKKFMPRVICVEDPGAQQGSKTPISTYLMSMGYFQRD